GGDRGGAGRGAEASRGIGAAVAAACATAEPAKENNVDQIQSKVGGETQAYCTSCKTMHEHIVVAMHAGRPAKVECVHCHKQHVYRAGPPGAPKVKTARSPSARARKSADAASSAPPIDLAARIAGRDPRPY